MPEMTFFRADGRTISTLNGSGFAPRAALSSVDLSSKLADLPVLSREIVDAGRASFWVSTALDEDCMGQVKGNTVYKFIVDVEVYQMDRAGGLVNKTLPQALGGLNSKLGCFIPTKKPHLVMNNTTISTSTIIGLLHGQVGVSGTQQGTGEVSFFTTIPGDHISQHAAP